VHGILDEMQTHNGFYGQNNWRIHLDQKPKIWSEEKDLTIFLLEIKDLLGAGEKKGFENLWSGEFNLGMGLVMVSLVLVV